MDEAGIRKVGDLDISNLAGVGVQEMLGVGFQSSHVGQAIELLKTMREDEECRIMLSFTANLMASGLRGLFRGLVEQGVVDCVVTTGGSIDHDIIRAYKPYLLGDFDVDDEELHRESVNRLGNIMVPNDRYELLEEKIKPVLEKLNGVKQDYTPSEFIEETAKVLNNKDMFIKTCLDKNVPVFCPSLVDSAIGLQLFFFKQDHKEFTIDSAGDLKRLHDFTMGAEKLGGVVIGGGVSKHHLIGSTLLRGGLDYAIYLTTALEYDGSLSGARPKEAKSWGKIREVGNTVTVYGDATLTLPLILSKI
ncbi:MAG TPA: deoxyhypusine synthase [Candidatus Altiarchaeales archaeon]|nr:deoxyhypusine synthase [Candidatus Altiarchaeales archaeon]